MPPERSKIYVNCTKMRRNNAVFYKSIKSIKILRYKLHIVYTYGIIGKNYVHIWHIAAFLPLFRRALRLC
ncbi:MAG: hypothetical protein EGQ91_02825 [Clostridiales bacterium]|nr:hypothetical protein [Clostridiales bacterium]